SGQPGAAREYVRRTDESAGSSRGQGPQGRTGAVGAEPGRLQRAEFKRGVDRKQRLCDLPSSANDPAVALCENQLAIRFLTVGADLKGRFYSDKGDTLPDNHDVTRRSSLRAVASAVALPYRTLDAAQGPAPAAPPPRADT